MPMIEVQPNDFPATYKLTATVLRRSLHLMLNSYNWFRFAWPSGGVPITAVIVSTLILAWDHTAWIGSLMGPPLVFALLVGAVEVLYSYSRLPAAIAKGLVLNSELMLNIAPNCLRQLLPACAGSLTWSHLKKWTRTLRAFAS